VKPGIPALFVFAFAAAQPSNDIVFISNETGEVSYLPGEPTRAAWVFDLAKIGPSYWHQAMPSGRTSHRLLCSDQAGQGSDDVPLHGLNVRFPPLPATIDPLQESAGGLPP